MSETIELPVERLAGKRALVTGGRGFIGNILCRRLAHLGVEVFTAGRSPRRDDNDGRDLVCDLSDIGQATALVREVRPDHIYHLASHVLGARSADVVLSTYHNNLTSTVNLLFAAHRHGCERLVLSGSLEEPEPALAWPVPSSPYAAAKLAASTYGRMFHALFDLPVVILRVFMVYGPGSQDRKKLVPYVIESLLAGEPVSLSSGTREVDWVFVEDVAEAFIRAAVAGGVEGRTYDVGSGSLVTVRAVVERIYARIRPDDRPVFGALADRKMEQVRVADVQRSAERLGWHPRTSLDAGLQATIDWFREKR